MSTLIDNKIVSNCIKKSEIKDFDEIGARKMVLLVNMLEKKSGTQFIRMEMGIPGLKTSGIAMKAEMEAHAKGFSSIYPIIDGIDELKIETSRFAKLFLNLDISKECCVPTVGSMQGAMATFLVTSKIYPKKNKTLFIDPGFPIQKKQLKIIGHDYDSFDIYKYRGDKLKNKLEEFLKTGEFSTITYSNPNNPTWINFKENELKIIGELADKYDVIVVEDLAYFGMDTRENYITPGKAPFQPSVSQYTDNYVLLLSSSKIFNYAGQRIGMILVSNKLYKKSYPNLSKVFSNIVFGKALIYDSVFTLSSGAAHTVQYGFAALLRAANNGEYDFKKDFNEYSERAKQMKNIFVKNGFEIVYKNDIDRPIANGFYFSCSYPGMSGSELLKNLLNFGISAISLKFTGSDKQGLRACVSQISQSLFDELNHRLKMFNMYYLNC